MPRLVRLSAHGDAFLPRARLLLAAHQDAVGSFEAERRRLVVGISQHIVGTGLPFLLRRMGAVEPALVLDMRVAISMELLTVFGAGELDASMACRRGCA